ncbi:MAG: PIG-L family deacetylase, partial [Candidatus Omnitrophica bacterium]|nr:PIG-L family deacetylase [Candidatus Omnitrophota bacterium]
SFNKDIRPDIVYTHHYGDLNIDHRIAYKAVLTACRPVNGGSAREIYSFETPSSTEWNYPNVFNPNVFIDITRTFSKKIEAIKHYKVELRGSPHPRSIESIDAIAKKWGSVSGLGCAEAFEAIRIIR